VTKTGDGRTRIKWLRPTGYKWARMSDRKFPYLLLVFKKPEGYIVLKQTIRCWIPTFWVLAHGNVRNWRWLDSGTINLNGKKIMDSGYDMGLLVPRMFWLGLFFLPAKRKVQFFELKAERYDGPVPD